MGSSKGFALIELLVVISIIGILCIACLIGTAAFVGNFWFTEGGILRKAQLQDESLVSVRDVRRNIFSYSVVIIENSDGERKTVNVGSNILFSYDLEETE
ncbi:MAG: prepilin-type N-terminal cleavage/methylation domain-containing protein [Candidatus Pacebacteria bacterium]|nr:prepilin-type N-terminal cleavage/methylation domain-containing protein [Candidatus Paceibacterota bacterium]